MKRLLITLLLLTGLAASAQFFSRTLAFRGVASNVRHDITYNEKVLATEPANLIGYWPGNEASGTAADDLSTNGYNGAFSDSGITYAQAGPGNGNSAVYLDGTNSFLNVYGAGVTNTFNGNNGTLMFWLKLDGWPLTGDIIRYFTLFRADANNQIFIRKDANGQLNFYFKTGAVTKNVNILTKYLNGTNDWICYALTWSTAADEIRGYLNGDCYFTNTAGVGTWSGALNSDSGALWGSDKTNTTAYHAKGWVSSMAVWNTNLTRLQIQNLLTPSGYFTTITAKAPTAVGSGHQVAWHDFSQTNTLFTDAGKTTGVAVDGDNIYAATNLFSGTYDLATTNATTAPVWKENIQNGLGAAYFNGSNSMFAHLTFSNDFTLFMVVRNNDADLGSHLTIGGATWNYLVLTGVAYEGFPGKAVFHPIGGSGPDANDWANSATNAWTIVEARHNGTEYTVAAGGMSRTKSNTNNFIFSVIGPERTAGWWFDGYLGERIFYDSALSDADQASVRLWLAAKWNLPNTFYYPFAP